MIKNYVHSLITKIVDLINMSGLALIFLGRVITTVFSTKLQFKEVLIQIERIGIGSLLVILLTGTSAGLALALQTYIGLNTFGGQNFIGVIVTLGIVRELAPVLTGLMVMGRAGSSIAAEIGTMKITEQIDALKTLCINPLQYLIVPRLVASTIILPLLTAISMLCGIGGGYYFAVKVLEINSEIYLSKIQFNIELQDMIGGLIKAGFFGIIVGWIGSFFGYYTTGGARGVGVATTHSVVIGSILILLVNYILSSFLFATGYN